MFMMVLLLSAAVRREIIANTTIAAGIVLSGTTLGETRAEAGHD
jgi:hypothetical protein